MNRIAKAMRFSMALLICTIGVMLPWRARIVFSEALGWLAQLVYWIQFSMLKFILKNLRKAGGEST